VVKRNRWQGPL